jgi:hypothetical protein
MMRVWTAAHVSLMSLNKAADPLCHWFKCNAGKRVPVKADIIFLFLLLICLCSGSTECGEAGERSEQIRHQHWITSITTTKTTKR